MTSHTTTATSLDSPCWIRPATVQEVEPDGRLEVRVRQAHGDATERHTVRPPAIPGYAPAVGDRLLVAHDGEQSHVLTTLHTASVRRLELPDGCSAAIDEGVIELRDPGGRPVVRFGQDVLELSAPGPELRLSAPRGRVVLDAATDVVVQGRRDVSTSAGRRLQLDAAQGAQQLELDAQRTRLSAGQLEIDARQSRLATGSATVFARSIAVTAERAAQHVEHYELVARKIVEKTRDSFREVTGLAQSRVGRVRTLVRETFHLQSRRSVLISKEETSIDGDRILLG